MNRDSRELYEKLKPFLAVEVVQTYDKIQDDRSTFYRDAWPNTRWMLIWWVDELEPRPYWRRFSKRGSTTRPTYKQFCHWYKLPLQPFEVPSHKIVEVEINAQKN